MSGNIFSWIEYYIQFLLIPVQNSKLEINLRSLNCASTVCGLKKTKNHQIQFAISYAKQILLWEMHLNPLYPELGPDVIIEEGDFLQNESLQTFTHNLPSLARWNPFVNISLLKVLKELLRFYKEHQVKLLQIHAEKLALEYDLLMKGLEIKSNDFEILVLEGFKQIDVKFLIKLQINWPIIIFFPYNSSDMEVLLLVYFYGPTYNQSTPELYLPSLLQHFINGSNSLHIPPLNTTQHLVDYIIKVRKCIFKKVDIFLDCFEKRRKFVTNLLVLQYTTTIEYDIIAYEKVSLLLEFSEFYFILCFLLPMNFPNEKFLLTFHSVYHMSEEGKPVAKVIKDFPYNSRWSPKQMIINALAYIIKYEMKNFQEVLNKKSRF